MIVPDYKTKVIEAIKPIENENTLKQIYLMVHTFLDGGKQTPEKPDNKISFEEWNEQFTDDKNLDDFIAEYGMTLREFRKGIYEAEMSEGMSLNEFQQKLRKLYENS